MDKPLDVAQLPRWRVTFDNYKLVNLGGGHYHLMPSDPERCGGGTRISFLPGEYIAIYGDLCPGQKKHDNKGVFSTMGYGLGWLQGRLSPNYLAEKFQLGKVFSKTKAEAYCREQATQCGQEEDGEGDWMELADDAANVDPEDMESIVGWIDQLHRHTDGDSEALAACHGYDGENLELLVDIQRAFARLVEVQNG